MTSTALRPGTMEMTEDEYVATLANSKRFEFEDGTVRPKRGPYITKKDHVTIANKLTLALVPYAEAMGGFGGQTPTSNLSREQRRLYRIPDFAYWAPGRPTGDAIFTVPTLAIEIVSDDQDLDELRDKCRQFRERGVDVVWLVDPRRRTAHAWEGDRDGARVAAEGALESTYLPGFSLSLAELFGALDS